MPTSPKTTPLEKFGDLRSELARTTGWGPGTMARRMGISTKTLLRYENGHPPTPTRARDMVQLLTGIDPSLHARIAASLGVPSLVPPPAPNHAPTAPLDPSRARSIVDTAILEASEQLGLIPATTRAVGRLLADALLGAGLDLATAREHLNPRPKRTS